MTGDSPLTVTVSCSVATPSGTLTWALNPSVTRMPFAHDVLKARQLEGEFVFAGRHCGKPVDARFIGDGRQRADLGGARGGDGHAGQHAALRIFHFAADAAGASSRRRPARTRRWPRAAASPRVPKIRGPKASFQTSWQNGVTDELSGSGS